MFGFLIRCIKTNYIDGSVFLCSVLEKIGIKTFLIIEPRHIYMGFYTSNEKSVGERTYGTIETTAIGSSLMKGINLNLLTR